MRLAVVASVLLLHGAAGWAWLRQSAAPTLALHEMQVSVAPQQADIVRQSVAPEPPALRPKPKVETDDIAPPEEKTVVPSPATPDQAETAAEAVAPVVDAEPDYRADYLNNPRPAYPLAARRMGYQGKVLLNVEVLAEGHAGQVLLYASSGHEVLDRAALLAVKSWRFTPARQAGRVISKWFIVPINFSLEG